MSTTLEIDVYSRWDAVELLGRLSCYHSHLVQLDVPGERWLVRARTPGEHGEGIVGALAVIDGVAAGAQPRLRRRLHQRRAAAREADVAGLSLEADLRPASTLHTGT